MKDKDELLELAEGLYTALASQVRKRSVGKRQVDVDDNLLKRFVQYYIRHRRDANALDSLLKLLAQKPPKRGGGFVINWEEIQKTLQSQEKTFRTLSHHEVAYILSWMARLARAKA